MVLNLVSETKDDGLTFGLWQLTLFPATIQTALPFVLECVVSGGGITWYLMSVDHAGAMVILTDSPCTSLYLTVFRCVSLSPGF